MSKETQALVHFNREHREDPMFSAKEEVNAPSSNDTKCSETVIDEDNNKDDIEDITNTGSGDAPPP